MFAGDVQMFACHISQSSPSSQSHISLLVAIRYRKMGVKGRRLRVAEGATARLSSSALRTGRPDVALLDKPAVAPNASGGSGSSLERLQVVLSPVPDCRMIRVLVMEVRLCGEARISASVMPQVRSCLTALLALAMAASAAAASQAQEFQPPPGPAPHRRPCRPVPPPRRPSDLSAAAPGADPGLPPPSQPNAGLPPARTGLPPTASRPAVPAPDFSGSGGRSQAA